MPSSKVEFGKRKLPHGAMIRACRSASRENFTRPSLGSPITALLERYLGEVVSRCSVILALYGRPHSSECAVNEHREILVALRRRDEAAASLLMERHLSSVAERARLSDEPAAEPQLEAILSRIFCTDHGRIERGGVPRSSESKGAMTQDENACSIGP